MDEPRHESQEPELRGVLIAGAVVTVIIALGVGVSLGLVAFFGGFGRPLARAEHNPLPEPHLQAHPVTDLQRYDQQQESKLSGYRWVDRGAGIVRIPIDRAMRILVEQGGPAAVPEAVPGAHSMAPRAAAPRPPEAAQSGP